MTTRTDAPWLVALDIDGTTMHEDGTISGGVLDQVRRLAAAGHEVMLATGRSSATTLPVLERLDITPRFVVCSNGAITLHRDPASPTGYRREWVETFDPTDVLLQIRSHLVGARYAVEDERGFYRYTEPFPDATIGLDSEHVEFDDLLRQDATRVVVISPDHDMEDFLQIVDRMGLNRVSYAIGWTAWLDIAPDGVNKATAMERVRAEFGIPRSRVMAVGDGRNDIEMLQWASVQGRGVAMGQAPHEVLAAAGEITGAVHEDGLALVLSSL
ncbi:HAD family hydrolase [Cryobacterium sp. TMT2-18-3]|uniref:HAD family hydrolase n=1 Tax=unclassified Cryobacterium TaxID=2649013 RepID=UPI001069DFF1|nr:MULTISPECIES: HAD family hydrolase [unclassified Cryobacterium]TFC29693.1 HAD family hydrolase [Cryobacterium sp. TMT2-18-2]TFC39937.1 HAD family hydrolase [Cryobacterium sp. TMT2-42-4]TFC65747.1 HAD family hydrolase [Cryobacterium sp. TMT2-18-3]